MADNTTLNAATVAGGDTYASDDIGGVKFQRVKLVHGIDGTNDGDVASGNGLPVQVVSGMTPGTGATDLGKAEDEAHTSGDVGVMTLAVRNDSLAALAGTDGDYATRQVNADGALYTTEEEVAGRYDVFGRVVVSAPNNDIDVQFFRGAPESLVDVTTANSATATQNVGGALFASSTNASGSVQGVSKFTTLYRSGFEVYAMFTAAFTAGIASSFMRLGLYDANNGFFIGYEGTSFGVTVRNATSDTTVAKASFSEDALTGAAGSRFTRAGTPEAIDLTKLNVFRIRFGWLGSAPTYWEVMAPDGHWVTFHKTLFPNLQASPSIRNADLPMTLDITKTAAAATDLQIQTDCWGAGTNSAGRVLQDDYAFQTTALLADTETYDSGVLALSPHYSQVQTTILASHDGDITILWYADFGGTDLVRTLVIPYTAANGFQMFAAPAFTPYVKYQFNNDSGSTQTDFYFDTKFLTKSLSPQIIRVDGPVAGGMVASVARSVIVGQTGGGAYVNVGTTNGGSLKINMEEIAETAVDVNAGNASAGTQRVVLASDQPVISIDDNAGSLTVDNGGTFAVQDSTLATNTTDLPNVIGTDGATGPTKCVSIGVTDGSGNLQELRGDTDGHLLAHVHGETHGAAVSSEPVVIAGEARTTTPTAVDDGDVVRIQCDDQGRVVTSPLAPRDLVLHNQITLTNTTETTLIAAAASTFHDIVTLAASNTSATKVRVDIRDSTTGTVRWSMSLAADGGGFVLNLPVPLTQAAVNNNWTAQLSGSVTDVRVMAVAVKRV
jgi:hypothetical protein